MNEVAHQVSRIAAGLALIAVVAAGCGGERVAEQVAEQAIDGTVELEDDSISITDDEGNEFAAGSGTEIPQSWPKDVPVFPSGELVLATSQADGSATALWQSETPVDVAAAEYDSILLSRGFTLDQDALIAGAVVRTYSNSVHTVNVTIALADGSTNVNTTVLAK